MPESEDQKSYYTVHEICTLLNLSAVTVRRYIKDKKIKGFYKIGREWRIEKPDFEKFLAEVKNQAT
jgi:excisionase family DNA binding protein